MEEQVTDKNKTAIQSTKIPFGIERHLDFIDISAGGCVLLGSSNLTGKYWNGSVFYYKDPDLVPIENKWVTGHNCESGVTAGKFLDAEDQVIVGEDSGVLTIFNIVQLDTEDVHFVPQMYASHHDNSITSIDITKNTNQAVSGGLDLCINVWDTLSLTGVQSYWPAHARAVTSIATNDYQPPLFVSTSLDGLAIMWDSRMSKPAQVIKEDRRCSLTSVCWLDGGNVACGSQKGSVFRIDPRSPAQIVSTMHPYTRPLHLLAPNNKLGLVAMCADASNIVIWDINSNILMESERRHDGFVRGISWHQEKSDVFYSCGLDKNVLSHTAQKSPVPA